MRSSNVAVTVPNQSNDVDPDTFPVIKWQGVRVVTTETLALGYATDTENIRRNLNRNRDRFIDGVHVFTIEGDDLNHLRVTNGPAQISNKARTLTLWAEKGAARMSKIVDTDAAWDFFEKMETAYFHPEQHLEKHAIIAEKAQLHMMLNESAARMLNLPQSGKLLMLRKTFEHYGVPDTLPEYGIDAPDGAISSEVTFSLTALLQMAGVSRSAASVNKLLEKAGILQKLTRQGSKGVDKSFWNLTEAGLRFGKNVTSERNPRETQPHFYKSQFGKLLEHIGI